MRSSSIGDVHLVGLLHHRQHVDPGERGLTAALVVVLGDADHPVRALLAAEGAVGVGRLDRERGGLDARLAVGDVVDLGRVLVPLGPAQVHPLQVPREVLGVGAARLRVDRDQRLADVVLAVQQRADLEGVDVLAHRREVGDRLVPGGLLVHLLGELEHHLGVGQPLPQAFHPRQLALQVGQPPGDLLRARLVLPEPRVGGLLAQVGRLDAHRLRVDHCLDGVELGRQFRYLVCGIGSCHAGKPTRIRACQRIQHAPTACRGPISSRSVAHEKRGARLRLARPTGTRPGRARAGLRGRRRP